MGLPVSFASSLADALAQRFGVRLPIVEHDPGTACILVGPVASYGDPYSGYSSHGTVALLHFVRPDDQTPMSVTLQWSVHETSGQLDDWRLQADGFGGAGMEALRAVFAPRGDPHIGNNARFSVVIDGVEHR